MATYDLTSAIPSKIVANDILNVPYSGRGISITLQKGKYKLECWGAQGGYRSSSNYGGKGGKSTGTLTLNNTSTIYIYAGGAGNTGKTGGGFNGGGKRSTYNGGGGGSDVRIGTDSVYARVIVAGGGGSDGASSRGGGAGGGTTGQDTTASNYGTGGYAGTQTGNNGGSGWLVSSRPTDTSSQANCYAGFYFGGNGVYSSSGYGGAGGGGWYGGTGTMPDGSGDDDKGGGGGSGYVYTSSTASSYPSGCLLNSSMYLDSASTNAGTTSFTSPTGSSETGHSGDGYVRITVIEAQQPTRFYIKTNGAWKEHQSVIFYSKINGAWRVVG